MSEQNKKIIKTKVGGQALIEGVMMLGPKKGCMAVRQPDREIYTEVWDRKAPKWYNKAPFIRGCINFVSQLADGYKYLNKSGEVSGMFDEEEDEKDKKKKGKEQDKPADNVSKEKPEDKKDEKKDGDNAALTTAVAVISGILGVGLAVALFVILPTLIFTGIQTLCGDTDISAFRSLTEGIIKIALFVGYLWLTSLMKTMKRLYQYHGAEHKTIFCYEHGLDLTVGNVRIQRRFHPRCGTSFLILMVLVSIFVTMFIPAHIVDNRVLNVLLRSGIGILLLPVIMGIGYELLKFAGRHDNLFTRIISAPGMWLQHITTREPDDSMIECAIAAVKRVIPDDGSDKW